MKTLLALLLALNVSSATGQQSDYELKQTFERRVRDLKTALDSTQTLSQMDSLREEIDALERDFAGHKGFLDRALYPQTFLETITALRESHLRSFDRTYLIQTQGIRIADLEQQVSELTARLDTMTAERDRLLGQLQSEKKAGGQTRATSRRLASLLEAQQSLILALVDSIFRPYGGQIGSGTDYPQAAAGKKFEQANLLQRLNEIVVDNLHFLHETDLQPADFGPLLDQQAAFVARWRGLRDQILAVSEASRTALKQKGSSLARANEVDSLVTVWGEDLDRLLWASLAREFSQRGIVLKPFADGPGFSESLAAYVTELKASGADPTIFVDEVWRLRIDREWRSILTKERVLGKAEYASLDALVSQLAQKTVDQEFFVYFLIIALVVLAAWWLARRSRKVTSAPEPKDQS
jgi:hypothetical protein